MHHWDLTQFWLLYAANLCTALAYYIIPLCWTLLKTAQEESPVTQYIPAFIRQFQLTRIFVLSCGTHHFIMLPAMWLSRGWDVWFWALLVVDGVMACVSLLTAFKAYDEL